jgi:hypothetical protein
MGARPDCRRPALGINSIYRVGIHKAKSNSCSTVYSYAQSPLKNFGPLIKESNSLNYRRLKSITKSIEIYRLSIGFQTNWI